MKRVQEMVRQSREPTQEDVVLRTWKMEVGGQRKIGSPKLRWSDVIRKHMNDKVVKIEEAQGRRTWTLKTRCADPKWGKAEEEEYIAPMVASLKHSSSC